MDSINLYKHYVPSLGAAVAVTLIFSIVTSAHIILIIKTKRKFPLIMVMGGLFEIAGHGARIYTRYHLDKIPPFSAQVILILLAPILFAAGIYMVLGRLIHASGYPHLSPIRRTWITKIFLLGDIFCFLVQLFGAAKLVDPKTPKDVETGQNIILAGLGLQIIIFGFFIIVGVTFHVRFRKRGRAFKKSLLEQQLYTIYICSILVLVRSVFRLLEYKNGEDGYLMRNEWPVYAFDVFLMAVVMIISLNWYRGSLEPDVHGDSLLLDG